VNWRQQLRRRLAALAFGPRELSQFCALGLPDPQRDIKVWLVGMGPPRDITGRNVLAGTRPLVVGISLDDDGKRNAIAQNRLSLEFRESRAGQTLLGKVELEFSDALGLEGEERLCLFRTRRPVNYCLPRSLLWRRYLDFAYDRWRKQRGPKPPENPMAASEVHALFIFYICPRPIVLVSVVDGDAGNIFPMDLIGQIGRRHFSLALHTTAKAVPIIERTRRVVLSSVPVEEMSLAYQMGRNHHKASVEWASLPFALTKSVTFGLPVPTFALRVRELEVLQSRDTGSHRLFICKVVDEHPIADGLQFFQAHGFYDEWRKQAIPLPAIH
jgi:flavin reductase (DIM6/NTAB) family NADH-FMN oxidoreductase RutF